MIAGGKDKNMDFAPLVPFVQGRVKLLILVGEAKEKINMNTLTINFISNSYFIIITNHTVLY
jgi:UDP-N-acetylmuramoylalanine-D-glutamate ligase